MERTVLIALLVSLLTSLTLEGCSSSELRVESNPVDAEVAYSSSKVSQKVLGKTPLLLNNQNAAEFLNEVTQLRISKDGYETQTIIFPKTRFDATGKVTVTLNVAPPSKECIASSASNSEIAKGIAEGLASLSKKDYDKAERGLLELNSKYPDISVVHDLLGNVYYLKKDFGKALASYQHSFDLQPNNASTKKMIEKIKGLKGGLP